MTMAQTRAVPGPADAPIAPPKVVRQRRTRPGLLGLALLLVALGGLGAAFAVNSVRATGEYIGVARPVSVGTVIVREVLAGGRLETITAMVRLADGTFPLGGNYWYAAADPDGTIRKNAQTGAPTAGLLESCGTCHLRRSHDDYLFGTPERYAP